MSRSLVCALLLCRLVCADVTMRSKMDYRLGSFVPAAAAEGMNKQMGDMLANGTVLRIKGTRSYMSAGPLITITDREKGTITLLDTKGRRYATVAVSEYGDKMKAAMPQIPDAAKQLLQNLKFDVKSDKTGKTDTIKGIKAEENLITVSVEMPGPSGPGMSMKMEMHVWMATPDELARVPALKEIAAYMTSQAAGTDIMGTVGKMFGQIPGFADKMKAPMEELMKAGSNAVLRSEIKMMMPMSAKMMGATNPDEPFMDLTTDMAELSTDPVPDSAFQVPAGYQEAKLEEVVSTMNPAKPEAPKQEPPKKEPPAAAAGNPGGAMRIGNGVTAPSLVAKTEPEYSEEDRQARVQGSVTLYIQVSPEGKAQNMRVLRSLSPGLDQKAMEAVAKWTFRPGTKDGRPVTVEAQVEVNFRLLDGPPAAIPPEIQRAAQVGGYPAKSTAPTLVTKVEAEYTEEARRAKYQGTVMLSARITAEGAVEDVRVVHALGLGLDEKAIEAVKKWKFQPATKDGQPVATITTIEVNFRL